MLLLFGGLPFSLFMPVLPLTVSVRCQSAPFCRTLSRKRSTDK
jgi:hypothetical protein